MNTQGRIQQRALQLLNKIGRGDYTPDAALRDFTKDEIREARVLCFEGGYIPAGFAMRALEALNATEPQLGWLSATVSRPSASEPVEITYFLNANGSPRRGAGFCHPHVIQGYQWWLLTPNGNVAVQVVSWRPFVQQVMQ